MVSLTFSRKNVLLNVYEQILNKGKIEKTNGEKTNGEMVNSPAFGSDVPNGDMRPAPGAWNA